MNPDGMRVWLTAPYVRLINAKGQELAVQSLLVPNAVSKFQAKCAEYGFVPNVVNGRIML